MKGVLITFYFQCPYLNWTEIIAELDQPGFVVRDREGLILLMKALLRGLRDTIFPIALLYRPWANKDGQVSFYFVNGIFDALTKLF